MKNTIITSAIIVLMIISVTNVFAREEFSKKEKSDKIKSRAELLKFSVNDFVGLEDTGELGSDDVYFPKIEKDEMPDNSNDNSSGEMQEGRNIRQ